jgi:hypothetical protein
MDGNGGIHLEAQADGPAFDLDHYYFEHLRKAVGPANHHGFLTFSRQDQHGKTSCYMNDRLARSQQANRCAPLLVAASRCLQHLLTPLIRFFFYWTWAK